MKLSKTNYLVYRECKHDAWIKIHQPDLYHATPPTAFEENVMAAGNEVDLLARDLFPGGVEIERGDAARTAALVGERAPVLYQPVFETDQFTTACDVLVWNGEAYDVYEVKASTSGEDTRANDDLYAHDIAFQAEVLRRNNVPLGRLCLVRLNGDYVRRDTLELAQLLTQEDFGAHVATIQDAVAFEMDEAHEVLDRGQPLDGPCTCIYKGRSSHCHTFAQSNPDVPSYSIHDISRIGSSKRKLRELVDAGYRSIKDVPDDFPLSERQQNQLRAIKTGASSIDHAEISEFLSSLVYPLAFLDYESYAAAVPLFADYGAYDHIPFQFSLDVVLEPGGDVSHHEFLHMQASNPDVPLLSALQTVMPEHGSVIVWNQTFERGINDKLAARQPQFAEFLGEIDVRIVDLMEIFSMQAYVHPGFRGKTSIKRVLPMLVPELSYESLEIREGATATAMWGDVVLRGGEPDEVEKLRQDLLQYCALDTLAMVEIWRALDVEVARVAQQQAG